MEDPQQRTAAEVLDQQGRRKAQFLTGAILQYIRHPSGPENLDAPAGVDMSTLKRMMLEILQNDPQFSQGGHTGQGEDQENVRRQPLAWEEPSSDSVLAAMSNTLAAFRGK